MKHRLIDERDTVAEDEATQFRVAFAHPGNYVQMHDVESDDVRDVLRWAEEFNKSSETPEGTQYFVALRSAHPVEFPGDKPGTDLVWLTPPPESIFD
ncbi:hypothetical protein [Brachybacterium paraconglomeratum]|uniref:hypothetical protein n=1 Tax=Brachybacterium paraconglomeratum TaxID=173362 RepID=UPI0022E89B57|nr:hypothetical protein [Brachybacterium paraconglomeratum]